MKAFHSGWKFVLTFLLSTAMMMGYWPYTGALASNDPAQSGEPASGGHSHWSATVEGNDFVIEAAEEGTACREATVEESFYYAEREADLALSPINDLSASAGSGLSIVLRGTSQLEGFPHAKEAFLRAAATWQSLIENQITVIVDVDFGPKRFGQSYPSGVLGSTSSQSLGSADGYLSLRDKMIGRAADATKLALYNSLPSGSLPTDLGRTTAISTPSATLRALGEISPVANPTTETNFGNLPSIGFNSSFSFDFDPSDGIDEDKIDFDAVAVHEIGHVLGFISQAGMKEMSPSSTLSASVWDLFRFRPGVTLGEFSDANRVLSSGGEQAFFAGGETARLSTGRPNGLGGDGRQASHWKDDAFTGTYVGVMDPSLPKGQRGPITPSDLAVLDAMCYKVSSQALPTPGDENGIPVIESLTGSLNGNTLALTIGTADRDGDLSRVSSALLDGSNRVLSESGPLNVTGPAIRNVDLNLSGLEQFPTAMKVRVTLTDARGNLSSPAVLDFSVADSGGPNLKSGSFDSSGLLSLKGGPFTGELKLEINGVVVAPPLKIKKKGGGSKLKITGKGAELNLRSGPNRIRMFNDNLHSNILIITL